jgi:hypothetical protein
VAVVFSIPIYYVSNYVWSELLFVFLTILLVLHWPKILASEATPLDHALMALLIILATLQRFAGYSLVPIIMLSVLLFRPGDTWIKRTRLAVQYALTGIPMFLWLMYGQIVYYNRQARGEVVDKILDNLIRMPGLLTEWFLPPELQNRLIYILFSLILGIVLFGIIVNYYRLYRNLSVYPDLRSYPVLIAFYVVTFLLGLLVAFISARAPIDIRHMSPVHVFVVLLVFYVIDLFLQRTTRQAIKTTVLVFMMIWTIYPIVSVFNRMQLLGTDCCIANTIRDVDLIQWLRQNAIGPGDYYSNTPLPSVYTSHTVYAAPAKLDEWPTLLDVDKNVYLIWFSDPRPDLAYHGMSRYFYPLDFDINALNDLAEVTLVAEFDDGQIYRLQSNTLSKING